MRVRVLLEPPAGPPAWLQWSRWALLALGVVSLGVTGHFYLGSQLYQAREEQIFEEERQQPVRAKAAPVSPGMLIGRIEIPRLNVKAIVHEGVDSGTLRRAVGHVPGTALPGEDGNVALAAHRDTFFRGLRDVRVNDVIQLATTSGSIEYVVDSTRIVSPTEVEVLAPTRQRVLTLVTCYPFNFVGHAPKRFIVRAVETPSLREPRGS